MNIDHYFLLKILEGVVTVSIEIVSLLYIKNFIYTEERTYSSLFLGFTVGDTFYYSLVNMSSWWNKQLLLFRMCWFEIGI